MLRLANEHETAAFLLVERTLRRTRPRVGPLGLKAVDVPEGRIERGSLGRLRFRFDGDGSDFEPENRLESRSLSDEEMSLWNGLQRVVSATKPIADPEWNLVSMRIGPRILRRLPLGGVVTYVPNGTPPFKGSFSITIPEAEPELPVVNEAVLLGAIDEFLRESDTPWGSDPRLLGGWAPRSSSDRGASQILSTTLGHSRMGHRGKWYKCPICHTPVVKGLFNPRIPYGPLRPGAGAIRDLRGGYLSRLRETYLIADPNSLIDASTSSFGVRIDPRDRRPPLFET